MLNFETRVRNKPVIALYFETRVRKQPIFVFYFETLVRKQPIIALYFELENELKFLNLGVCTQTKVEASSTTRCM